MAKRTVTAPTREDYRLADIVSGRLRDLPLAERSRYFTDVVGTVLTEECYRDSEERRERFRAVCSIFGTRGGHKSPKTPRKAELAGQVKELFRKGLIPPAPVQPSSLPKPDKSFPPLWPVIADGMPEGERELARLKRGRLWNEMMYLARLRRDDLAREADGE